MPRLNKRPTSRDVARLAGVSQTTVSLVLNNVPKGDISSETRARVQKAIADLDYHPHAGARSLSLQATCTIGVSIPDASNPHYLDIVAGVEDHLAPRGYAVSLMVTNYKAERERQSLELLKQQRIDALIYESQTELDVEYTSMREQGYVLVGLLEGLRKPPSDHERLLLEHLIGLGHRRLGYIYGVASMKHYSMRLDAVSALHQSLGIPLRDEWVRICGPTVAEAYRATLELVLSCGKRSLPTALVAVNDLLATGVLAALFHSGIPVPSAMSVAGFDNTPLAPYTVPPLTSVDANSRTIGVCAAQLALSRLDGNQDQPLFEEAQPRLVPRDSTGPAPCDSGD